MSKKHKHISAVKTTEQKAVQQSQQPQELTPQKLNRLLEKNPFAQLLGMELLEVREGYAYGRMRMDEHFTNIYGGMHGGCSLESMPAYRIGSHAARIRCIRGCSSKNIGIREQMPQVKNSMHASMALSAIGA